MQYCIGFYKGIFLNHQLKVTDEELASYGLDDPELTVRVDYTDDGTSDTFVLHISRVRRSGKKLPTAARRRIPQTSQTIPASAISKLSTGSPAAAMKR